MDKEYNGSLEGFVKFLGLKCNPHIILLITELIDEYEKNELNYLLTN